MTRPRPTTRRPRPRRRPARPPPPPYASAPSTASTARREFFLVISMYVQVRQLRTWYDLGPSRRRRRLSPAPVELVQFI
ncbi:hypothetical protein EVAR_44487_1 [Eumeta japonica]|uniref:Uncharacterized protein n=1 Tax=Eumeta variegata TaxID=151549 RepID=A0A4C1WJT1_EUMVA|nr:hypothetical protein EVAR_44487_1 [Eumeta japonica]